ncbi:MAG: hypothetical protein JWM53_5468, partial [bacterium]|nr:hypothetical protein [bacterium]
VAAAAMLVLWLIGRPPVAAHNSAWIAVRAASTTADGKAIEIGAPLVVGALVHVGDGGAARLERQSGDKRAGVELNANSEARVGDGALELLTGSARLEGPEARLTGDVAEVTTLGSSAAATVELRRNPMLTKAFPKTAALAALLTVSVADGGARVVAQGHDPILLAKNDRTMVAPKLPPLTTRASKPAAAKKPAPAPAATKPAASEPPTAAADGELDKGSFRAAVQTVIGDIGACYEAALETNPNLEGRSVVLMRIVTKNGVGKVADGEVQPNEGDLNAPAMQQCVLQALSRAEFPPSVDGDDVIVHYPFVFHR